MGLSLTFRKRLSLSDLADGHFAFHPFEKERFWSLRRREKQRLGAKGGRGGEGGGRLEEECPVHLVLAFLLSQSKYRRKTESSSSDSEVGLCQSEKALTNTFSEGVLI